MESAHPNEKQGIAIPVNKAVGQSASLISASPPQLTP